MLKFSPKNKLMRFKPKRGLSEPLKKSKVKLKDKLLHKFGKYSLFRSARYKNNYVVIIPNTIYKSNNNVKCVIRQAYTRNRFVVNMNELTNFVL